MTHALIVLGLAAGATLPAHDALRVLVVSDEVNPHGLPDAWLTQPGEVGAALAGPGSGLALDTAPDAVRELPTNRIEEATAALSVPPCDPAAYDALVYFSHRIPDDGNNAQARQDAFTAAAAAFLAAGGGVVAFHHGGYAAPGKDGILDLVGATASGPVPWDTVDGQRAIGVAPGHFVASNGIAWTEVVRYADPARGVADADYPAFRIVPDERYPVYEVNPSAGSFTLLFASDYADQGTTHVLGFEHRRPGWTGSVVGWQPGEHEPQALDPAGPSLQVLVNAVVWSTRALQPDGLALRAVKGAAAGSVALGVAGGAGESCVHRAPGPAAVAAPSSSIGATLGSRLVDLPPAADVTFYRAVRP